MSVIKDLTPAILSAAVGIMASYDVVASTDAPRQIASSAHQQCQQDVNVANAIHELIRTCHVEEKGFLSAIKLASSMSAIEIIDRTSPDWIASFTNYLNQIRSLEVIMKGYEVPDQFAQLHTDARRAMAKFRSRAMVLHSMLMQSIQEPHAVPGTASPDGLRALASHSTKKLVVLANA